MTESKIMTVIGDKTRINHLKWLAHRCILSATKAAIAFLHSSKTIKKCF